MREIKFRAWVGKRFWFFDIHSGFNSENSDRFEGPEQFTGLKDKDGKDIYEGDILELPNNCRCASGCSCENKPTRGAVFWNEEKASFGASWHNILDKSYTEQFIIKLGNIHENKELLDETRCT